MQQITFYHAGCSICVEAEKNILQLIDNTKFNIETIHLGEQPEHLKKAKDLGVISVPAIVYDKIPFHINFGAAIEELES